MIRFRKWLANTLAGWARRIYPESEEAMAFYMDRMVEAVICGQSIVKVSTIPPEQFAAKDCSQTQLTKE